MLPAVGERIVRPSENVFGKLTGEKLTEITERFTKFAFKFRNWLGIFDNGETRLSKIRKGLQGVFSIVKTGINFIKIGFNLVKRLVAPVADVLINLFEKFGIFFDGMGEMSPVQVFTKIGDGITILWNKLKNLFTVGEDGTTPISTFLSDLWTDLKKVIREWANENGLGGVLDSVVGVWNTITGWQGWTQIADAFTSAKTYLENAWNTVSSWQGWADIGNFFRDVWGWLTGKTSGKQKPVMKQDANMPDVLKDATTRTGKPAFALWLESAKKSIEDAWNAVVGWPGWEQIGQFISDAGAFIGSVANTVIDWFAQPTPNGKTGFSNWLANVKAVIERVWNAVSGWQGWTDIAKFCGDIGKFLGEKFTAVGAWLSVPDESGETGLGKWLNNVWNKIKGIWSSVAGWSGWEQIGQFFSNIWAWLTSRIGGSGRQQTGDVMELISGGEVAKGTIVKGGKTGLEQWLETTWANIKSIWNEISVAGAQTWADISQFVTNIWDWITGKSGEVEGAKSGSGSSNILSGVVDAATGDKQVGILERLISAFSGFFDKVVEFAGKIEGNPIVKDVWKTIENVLASIARIARIFSDLIKSVVVDGNFGSALILGTIAAVLLIINILRTKFTAKITGNMATIAENTQSIGLQFLEVAGGIALMAAAIAALTAIDQNKAWTAVGQLTIIGAVIAVIVGVLANLKGKMNDAQGAPVTMIERIGGKLINMLTILGVVGIAMEGIPKLIESFGKVEGVTGRDVLDTLLGIVAFVGGISLVFAAVNAITGNQGINPKAAAMTAISVIAALGIILAGFGTMFSLQGGIMSIFGTDAKSAVDMINSGVEVFCAIGNGLRKIILSFLGLDNNLSTQLQDQEYTEDQLNWLNDITDKFSIEKLTSFENMLNLFDRISQVHVDWAAFDAITDYMPQIGADFGAFATNIDSLISGEDSAQKLDNMLVLLSGLESFAKAVSATTEALKVLRYDSYIEQVDDLFNEDSMTKLTDLYGEAAGRLAAAIQRGLGEEGSLTFNATPIVDAIVIALGFGETAIATAVHDMVQQGLIAAAGDRTGSNGGFEMPTLLTEILGATSGTTGDLTNAESWMKNLDLEKMFYGEDGKSGILGDLKGITSDLEGMDSIGDMLATKIGGSMFTDSEGNSIDAVSMIQEEIGQLQQSIQNLPSFEIKIVPVFDMSGLTAEAIQQQLFQRTFGIGVKMPDLKVSLDNTLLVTEMQGVNARLDGLMARVTAEQIMTRTAINGMSSHIDGICSSIEKIQIILDTDVLVGGLSGGIDYSLGARGAISARTGVTPKVTP